ncbi:uncharacterized protein DEA37_0005280 [Paragonimus westermani]|uniref:DUF7083 domain-containing protein n=1 Tax=Paragonimus westermani TaxID=34504 RepID=A0A5J4NJZ6_9TREM|nr:uncharacterized protein DEA37_0005280 [Paragonimus westermani]
MTISMEQMQALLQQQQKIFEQSQAKLIEMLTQKFSSQSLGVANEDQLPTPESMIQQVSEFHFDAIGGVTFDSWFHKYEDIFRVEMVQLFEDEKVRLLLRRLGTTEHERFVNFILPKHPKNLTFEKTARTLSQIFDAASDITLISRDIWRKLGRPPLLPTHHTARDASGRTLKLAGEVTCEVTFGDSRIEACCFVTDHPGLDIPSLGWMYDLELLDQPVNSLCDQMKIHSRSETQPSRNTPRGISRADVCSDGKFAQGSTISDHHQSHPPTKYIRGQDKWTPAVILKRKRKVIYEVIVREDTWRRHVDQLRRNPGLLPSEPDPASLHWDNLLDTFDLKRGLAGRCQSPARQHQASLLLDGSNEQGSS